LKTIVDIIQEGCKKLAEASEEKKLSFRFKFMLESLDELKSNRQKKTLFFDFSNSTLYKFCLNFHKKRGLNRLEPLRPSLDDVLQAHKRGMWWRVGSAWTGHDTTKIQKKVESTKSQEPEILKLAKKNKMNTDIRRSIFVSIVSSEVRIHPYFVHVKMMNN
jgi:nucleolar MIF4G domain-containing protein 1